MTTTTKAEKPRGLMARLFKGKTPAVADVDEQISTVQRQRAALEARQVGIKLRRADAYGDEAATAALKAELDSVTFDIGQATDALAQLQQERGQANVRALLAQHEADVLDFVNMQNRLSDIETPEKFDLERAVRAWLAERAQLRAQIVNSRMNLIDKQNTVSMSLDAEARAAFVAGAIAINAKFAAYLDKNIVPLGVIESGLWGDK